MSIRPGIDQAFLDALKAAGVETAWLVRLDFKSEVACIWSGQGAITVAGSSDSILNGRTFSPLNGTGVQFGDNAFGASGSEAFEMSVAVPASPSASIAAASVYYDEYRGREAYIWRGLLIRPGDVLAQPIWHFRRVRSGAMDVVSISNDGTNHLFTLSIESHAASVSQPSGSTYGDQRMIDPNDSSWDYAAAAANGGNAPIAQAYSGMGGGGTLLNGTHLY